MFGKGAKFSLFKPAEEMVYIGLDEESRTKGKAAIDVVGAQTGKSTSSVLQQVFDYHNMLFLPLCLRCCITMAQVSTPKMRHQQQRMRTQGVYGRETPSDLLSTHLDTYLR